MRETAKQVGERYAALAADAQYLWKSAYADVARICRLYPRGRAAAKLERLADRYSQMAISSTYRHAAKQLRDA